ncbi:hypothetical protein [Streptomyces sp. N35]|uniref:hypothetical protein n=1 Tax=Streptomyces sp. N35 TaxID=2795730 RepID=UPI0018F45DAB|nr:hypothetical protein [Streptomyces sp. N35]
MAGRKIPGGGKKGRERKLADSAKQAGSITEYIGNMAQSLDVLRGWAQAQDGLSVQNTLFILEPVKAEKKAKSGPAPGDRAVKKGLPAQALRPGGRPDGGTPDGGHDARVPDGGRDAGASAVEPVVVQWHLPTPFLITRTYDVEETWASWGLRVQDLGEGRVGCLVTVLRHQGFDTALGDQVACSFGSESVDKDRRMVTFDGWINPMGAGFARFSGNVLVSLDKRGQVVVHPGGCVLQLPSGVEEKKQEAGIYRLSFAGEPT